MANGKDQIDQDALAAEWGLALEAESGGANGGSSSKAESASSGGNDEAAAQWAAMVVLVVDARSMARSAAAVVQGFENFDPALRFAGAVFNHLGSPRHLDYLREALEGAVRMPCLGGILRDEALAIPERHLGLVTGEDYPLDDQGIGRLADRVEEGLDLNKLIAGVPEIAEPASRKAHASAGPAHPVRIGVARDNAFCFYYPDNRELLEGCGSHLVFFSPMRDKDMPPDLDGVYFGGGYPELFADALAANESMRRQVREHSAAGMPIYAECRRVHVSLQRTAGPPGPAVSINLRKRLE